MPHQCFLDGKAIFENITTKAALFFLLASVSGSSLAASLNFSPDW
jgi:hypothetical protein